MPRDRIVENYREFLEMDRKGWFSFFSFVIALIAMFLSFEALSQTGIPKLAIELAETENPEDVIPAIKIVLLLTVLTLAPAILLMTTSFTRIVIVLSFIRQALGTQTMPPNQVIIGLSMFLTFFTMAPVWNKIEERAYIPYQEKKLTQEAAFTEASIPMKEFMMGETREADLALFYGITKTELPEDKAEVPLKLLIPAFMVSELKTAFQIGFLIYIPFLIIDMVISSILMAMGMMMLPPTVVSLPFKLVLFVLVDGWSLIVGSVVRSFQIFG